MSLALYQELRQSVDWNNVFRVYLGLEGQLNKPSERFLKSSIIERMIAEYSNGLLVYIDQEGRDFSCPKYDTFIEAKKCCFKNSTRILRARLKNGNRNSPYTSLPHSYAPYILFYYNDVVRIVETEIVRNYLSFYKGNIEVSLPLYETEVLATATLNRSDVVPINANLIIEAILDVIRRQTASSVSTATAFME